MRKIKGWIREGEEGWYEGGQGVDRGRRGGGG